MSNRPSKRRRLAVVGEAGAPDRPKLRMRPASEKEFKKTSDALVAEFGTWVAEHGLSVDVDDARLLLDWRFQYDDGVLDVWTVAWVQEFLLCWCPRKLSATAELCADMPGNVAAFVEFLAQTGRLDPASDRPSTIRSWCERNQAEFLREMSDPDNFGMAKSLFAGVGGLQTGPELDDAAIADLAERVLELDDDTVAGILGRVERRNAGVPNTFNPVRIPDIEERLDDVQSAPLLLQVQALAEFCAAPGAALTEKGHLRLADARELVQMLATGDELEGVRSATELEYLDRVVRIAVTAGAVRRYQKKLVEVKSFGELDILTAHQRIVEAALVSVPPREGVVDWLHDLRLGSSVLLLAALLHTGEDGLDGAELIDILERYVAERLPDPARLVEEMLPVCVDLVLGDFDELGLVEIVPDDEPCPDCDDEHFIALLTPAGVAAAVELLRGQGFEIPERPDPVGSSAAELVALAGVGRPEDWMADACAWLDASSDPSAARDLLTAVVDGGADRLTLMLAIDAVDETVPEEAAVEAMRSLLDGPGDGFALLWLRERGAVGRSDVAPERWSGAMVDILSVSLDAGGEEELVSSFGIECVPERNELLDEMWRLDHPRVEEVLDVLGARHPDKATAKRARRAAVKLRTRLGQEAARV